MNKELKVVITSEDKASPNINRLADNVENASKKLTALSKSSSLIQGAMGKLSQSFAQASETAARLARIGVAGLITGITALGTVAIKSASDFEQSKIAFDTMLGSAEKASKLLKEISDFAVKTPFELPDVVLGAKKLLAYGVEANNLMGTLKTLGDISAGVGREKLPQLILAFGQVRAATYLTGAELRQFTEAGVPLLEQLAKGSGKTASQIKEDMESGAKISFSEVEKALKSLTGEGGRFFNLMEKQSKSFGGVVSNIKDQFGRVLRTVVGIDDSGNIMENSIFAKVKTIAESFLVWLQGISPVIVTLFNNISNSQKLNFLVDIFSRLSEWVSSNGELVKNFLIGFASAFALLAIIGTITSLFNPFIIILTLLGTTIALLKQGWDTNWHGMRDTTLEVISQLTAFYNKHKEDFIFVFETIKNAIVIFIGFIKRVWAEFGDEITAITKSQWEVTKSLISSTLENILALFRLFKAVYEGDWKTMWEEAKNIAEINWNLIKKIFGEFQEVGNTAGKLLYEALIGWLEKLWQSAKEKADKIRDVIRSAFDKDKRNSPSIMDTIKETVNAVNSKMSSFTQPEPLAHAPLFNNGSSITNNRTVNVNFTGSVGVNNMNDINLIIDSVKKAINRDDILYAQGLYR